MEPTEQLAYILPTLSWTVDQIQTMQMQDPTPCAEFNVHDVMNHMMVLGGSAACWFRGEEAPEAKPHGVYGWVPAKEFRETMDDLLDVVKKSSESMDRTTSTPKGEMPASTLARLVALDGLIHGWDLASSTGQRFEVPPAVISSVDEFARTTLTPGMRDGDTFKDPIDAPDDASRLERLVAFSGRSL